MLDLICVHESARFIPWSHLPGHPNENKHSSGAHMHTYAGRWLLQTDGVCIYTCTNQVCRGINRETKGRRLARGLGQPLGLLDAKAGVWAHRDINAVMRQEIKHSALIR